MKCPNCQTELPKKAKFGFILNSAVVLLLLGLLTAATSCSKPLISLDPSSLNFIATQGAANPTTQTIAIWETGGATLSWSVTGDSAGLSVNPTNGSSVKARSEVVVSVDTNSLVAGNYSGSITFSAAGAGNDPQTIPVMLIVLSPPILVQTTWSVRWFRMTDDGKFTSEVGTSQFPSTFSYDWKTTGFGRVFDGYATLIGFQATATINMQRPNGGPVLLTVGSDDGARLYVDGNISIEDWAMHAFQLKSTTIQLAPGKHTLKLDYWQSGYGEAQLVFLCDPDVLQWYESSP